MYCTRNVLKIYYYLAKFHLHITLYGFYGVNSVRLNYKLQGVENIFTLYTHIVGVIG